LILKLDFPHEKYYQKLQTNQKYNIRYIITPKKMEKVIQQLQLKTLLERKIHGYNAAAVVGVSAVALIAFKKYFDGSNNRYFRDLTG